MTSPILLDKQQIRDNIGRQDTTRDILFLKFDEKVGIEECATRIAYTKNLSGGTDIFILGHATLGLLGTGKLGNSGGTYTDIFDVKLVTNPNNVFHERFKFTHFIDMNKTTATIDLINNKVK